MVSYAQNFEDVMLWRALGHVENGSYIDVGALSPDYDSVTKAFYENGWSGINIEPNPKFLAELKEKRPRDLNLGVAVSDEPGSLTLHIFDNPGLTTSQPDIAKSHQDGGMSAEVVEVQAQTLTEVWQAHVENGRDVHFLKVDVEGHEAAVIRGHDWSRFRPWVVVVEATFPNSRREVHDEWEPILLEADYLMAYRDGLNRFYVAKEHAELAEAFSVPPNVFDDFVLARFSEPLAKLETEFDKVEAALAEERSLRKATEERLVAVDADRQAVERRLAEVDADRQAVHRRLAEVDADHQAVHRRLAEVDADRQAVHRRLAEVDADRQAVERRLAEVDADRQAIAQRLAAREDELQIAQENYAKARKQADYFLDRSFAQSLFFKPSGRPNKLVERLMFHRSGEPRDLFRKWIIDDAGKGRKAFRMWLESDEYHALRDRIKK